MLNTLKGLALSAAVIAVLTVMHNAHRALADYDFTDPVMLFLDAFTVVCCLMITSGK